MCVTGGALLDNMETFVSFSFMLLLIIIFVLNILLRTFLYSIFLFLKLFKKHLKQRGRAASLTIVIETTLLRLTCRKSETTFRMQLKTHFTEDNMCSS